MFQIAPNFLRTSEAVQAAETIMLNTIFPASLFQFLLVIGISLQVYDVTAFGSDSAHFCNIPQTPPQLRTTTPIVGHIRYGLGWDGAGSWPSSHDCTRI